MTPWLFWIVAVVVVVGAVVYYLFGQKKGKREGPVTTEPVEPPEETGME